MACEVSKDSADTSRVRISRLQGSLPAGEIARFHPMDRAAAARRHAVLDERKQEARW